MSDPKKTIQSNSCLIKKKKMDQLDKLSNLPTGVTHQILSYLPIKQAVRTSILSSDWRYKWAQLPCLVFDDRTHRSGYPIAKVVDHVLLLHSGRIDTFKLSTFNYPAARDIDKWISHLSRSNVKVFVLKVWELLPRYNVFSCFFSFKDLTHLELCNCLLKPPTTFKGFRMLKSLHLQEVIVSGHVLGKLIACCPQLERIILCDLKGITDVTIDAPSIRFLRVRGSFEDVLLANTLNLVDVSIDWKQVSTISSSKLLRYFFELPRIERLTLKDGFLEYAVGSLTKNLLPTPCLCLKFLSIRICLNNLDEISTAIHLMRSAPALQELDILVRKGEETNDGKATYCLIDKQNWEFTQLQRMKVTGFSGVKAEVDFIEFLLLTSPGLQELEISFCQDVKKVDFSWLDDNQKTCAFTQLLVVKVTGFSGVRAEVDFIRFLLSSTSKVILQPASVKVYWDVFKLLPVFRRDSLHADLKLLGPSIHVQDSDDSSFCLRL
ncbi:putative F-box domain, leucine-rich repeat domain, L domain-containing protein [Rosa chinensis]|uniref:Putative F-box domain, leucine-rich repeat domain, L domain-containing protein n=1 Tax=Rosa chinensis TaxID=74649 RepID=A0A2P6RBZ9_ROSCH|nr:F-box/FBD/LRR-repeat protein At1g13570 [Rosa chinensis]PRQ43936.1 putative F-box domain, leucine-rich repeat domain, L domain-containing protein [Rosa chinensis]